jgi:hypothetical protein
MSDWIERAYEQREQKRKAHQHYWEVFPALAENVWRHIRTLIENDIAKLQEKFSELSSLQVFTSRFPLFGVRKLNYPAYYVHLTFDMKGQQLTVEQERKLSAQESTVSARTSFLLSLDEAHRNVLITKNGALVTPEYVSEYCLRPLIEE